MWKIYMSIGSEKKFKKKEENGWIADAETRGREKGKNEQEDLFFKQEKKL